MPLPARGPPWIWDLASALSHLTLYFFRGLSLLAWTLLLVLPSFAGVMSGLFSVRPSGQMLAGGGHHKGFRSRQ